MAWQQRCARWLLRAQVVRRRKPELYTVASLSRAHHLSPAVPDSPPSPYAPIILPTAGGQEHSAGGRGVSGTSGRHTVLAAAALQLPGPRQRALQHNVSVRGCCLESRGC